jgi:anti-anti-sigma regulatory factor
MPALLLDANDQNGVSMTLCGFRGKRTVRPPGIAVVELGPNYGSLDRAPLEQLSELLHRLAQSGPGYVVLDMTRTKSIGARFVGVLLSSRRRFKDQKRCLTVCGPNGACLEVLAMAGAHWAVPTHACQQEAGEELARVSSDFVRRGPRAMANGSQSPERKAHIVVSSSFFALKRADSRATSFAKEVLVDDRQEDDGEAQ